MDLTAPFYPSGALGFQGGLLVALAVGTGFGFFLERAGLGNGNKLASQFYLTDLTVFKVMFTAIVTAMLGLWLLGAIGLLDVGLIRLTPTYLAPQLVGGFVFGIGFAMGGYCPGTSCVAASSGRLDAFSLFAGMMAGVFLFAEAFPALRGFYMDTPLGRVTIPELFHIPHAAVVIAVVLVAAAGFYVAERVEARNGRRIEQPPV